MLRLLSFTTLFPNAHMPNHGVFVANRLRHLLQSGLASSEVIAPVRVFPGVYSARGVRAQAHLHGMRVWHPRVLTIPGLDLYLGPGLLYRAARRVLAARLAAGASFDLIDAHYFYPDGAAALRLAREFNLPLVITARGSDVTQFPDYPYARARILQAAAQADAVITVSDGLRRALIDLGADGARITVLRNGVDLDEFTLPAAREQTRRALGLQGLVLLSVGALIERKGHHRSIEALRDLPDATLLIAGEGVERTRLEALARRLGVDGRLRLLGAVPHAQLGALYGAADISILASSREGWANVLLESLACGTPVVASPIPGNDEVITAPLAGRLAQANTPAALASAVRDLQAALPPRQAVRAYAEQFSWDEVSRGQAALFTQVLAARAANATHAQPETLAA